MSASDPVAPSWRGRLARAFVSLVAIAGVASCGKVESNKTPDASGPGDDAMADDGGIDAPPKACTETTCSNDVLEVCGSNGFVEHTEHCALGCFTNGNRCNKVDPSNGLASHLDEASQQGDVTLPDGTTINTDTGMVTSPNGPIAVATATVTQSGAPAIRVLIAKSWTIDNVRVTGSLPLALVASEEITVQGVLDASADANVRGPGALTCTTATGAGGAPATGIWARPRQDSSPGYPAYIWSINGSGGGGYGTAGGNGGVERAEASVGSGGVVNGAATLVPLRGGCQGYAATATYAGAGGGAIQLVSDKQVRLVSSGARKGIVHVGGGGGHAGDLGKESIDDTTPAYGAGGGGSGGGILIEAPSVVLEDGTALLAAGGGGGGYGACPNIPNGMDAPPGIGTPTGGACPGGTSPASIGGNGATTAAGGVGGDATKGGSAGGGGGGLGRIRVNTADGQYSAGPSAVVRGAETTGTVGKR